MRRHVVNRRLQALSTTQPTPNSRWADQINDPQSLLNAIGNTPLVPIRRISAGLEGITISAKAEWLNPGGSVKDRPALSMILAGERSGKLHPGKRIIDATSGNTGIAYALIGALRGYGVTLALPANAGPERKRILKAYGARLILTDPFEGTDGAQLLVRELVASKPGQFFYPDQYNNDANWQAHYQSTAEEIWEQTGGRITHFVAGLGTTGTFIGTARRLKELNPAIQAVAFQPASPLHGLEGLKHLETAIVPGIYDPAVADVHLTVETEAAQAMVLRLAREEGYMVGVSAGAALVACLKVAHAAPAGSHIVTVFPDGADKYLSDHFWEEGAGA